MTKVAPVLGGGGPTLAGKQRLRTLTRGLRKKAADILQRLFQHRTGRVIALSRLVLAVTFLLAVWLDPAQPARHGIWAYALLVAYCLIAIGELLAVWKSWWLEYQLSPAAHALDILVFAAAVYATEGYSSSFTSPFFTFFLFLLFSATIRWGWKACAGTATACILLYVIVGLIGMQAGIADFDHFRFGRRIAYLFLLSLVVIWFGINQQHGLARRHRRQLPVATGGEGPPIVDALRYAAAQTGAKRGLLVWWNKEEPWITAAELLAGTVREQRFSPGELSNLRTLEAGSGPFLFDASANRAVCLSARTGNPIRASADPLNAQARAILGLHAGLCIAIRASDFEGELFLQEVPGLCCDDLRLGRVLGDEVSFSLDRYSMMSSGEETAVSRTRLIIARDLHDSVAQVLAGACFRLEAIRGWVRAGKDPDAEILAVKDALKVEQRNIRELIAKLRLGGDSVRQVDLIESLRDLTAELSRQWSIDCSLVRQREGRLSEPAWLTHEVQQLVREAVANAVRHGGTRSVSVHVSWTHEDVILSVTDRGTGFAAAGPKSNTASKRSEPRPWSIHSRITSLGGNLTVASNREGAQLTINIPRAEFR